MTPVAWLVFALLTAYTIWDGVRRTRGAKSLEGFFAAGRAIPWWAAGLSVMATQLSAITILSGVGLGYENGPEWVQFYFALPFAMLVLCHWFVPALRRHPILTAYEFLERRFGPATRTLTSLVFLGSRCCAFAVVLYAPAVVFSVMTGLPIGPTIWITGLATTGYTLVGGTGGVVWTDVKQMLLIVVGIGACALALLWQNTTALGLGGTLQALGQSGKLAAVEVWNPAWTFAVPLAGADAAHSFWTDKYNLWTGLFGTLCLFLSYFGCDQSQVQSILTARSADHSRRALLLSAFTKVPLQLLVLLLGGLLYVAQGLGEEPLLYRPSDRVLAQELTGAPAERFAAAAEQHAAARARRTRALQGLAAGMAGDHATILRETAMASQKARADARAAVHAHAVARGLATGKPETDSNYVFPHFLFHDLPKPLLGLLLAAIFAAAISSAAGALSSLTAATMVDLHRRWLLPHADETTLLRHSRGYMAAWGVLATAAAVWLGGGPLLERVNEVGSWFYGSILGVFCLALFVPRAHGLGACCGLLAGLLAVAAQHQFLQVAYLWDNLTGCVACVTVGTFVSVLAPRQATLAHPAPAHDTEPSENTRWGPTYGRVGVLAVLVMLLLWLLSAYGRAA